VCLQVPDQSPYTTTVSYEGLDLNEQPLNTFFTVSDAPNNECTIIVDANFAVATTEKFKIRATLSISNGK
jgi:hypothetical protein